MNSDLNRATRPGPATLPRLQVVVPALDPDHAGCSERDVSLTLHHGGATVADLGMALGLADRCGGLPRLLIDGRAVATGLPLRATGVCRGSVITTHRHADGPIDPDGETSGETSGAVEEVALRTVAGPDAGRDLTIGVGRHVVGRGSAVDVHFDDPALARRHAVIELDALGQVTITDLASPRPSRLDGVVLDGSTAILGGQHLTMGSTVVEVVALPAPGPPVPPPPPTGPTSLGAVGWTRPLRRPPRGPAPASVPPVAVPAFGAAAGSPVPLGMAAVVTTVVASCVVALVMHQPAFVILGAVGAVGTLGAGIWQRSRGRSRGKADRRRARESVARFAAELAVHQSKVAAHRRRNTMELADAVACARGSGPELWARRPGDANAHHAVVGRGEQVVQPALSGERGRLPDEAWALVEAASVVIDLPMEIDLGPGAVVGVVGPRVIADAVVRSLMLQLVVAHGPADLLVAGLLPPGVMSAEDRWLRWLPHTSAPSTGDTLVGAGAEVAAVLGALDRSGSGAPTDDGRAAAHDAHLLLVVHDPGLLAARNTATRQVLASDPSVAALILADDVAELPSICQTVVEVRTDGTAAIHRPGQAELAEQVVIAGASAATARQVALALAGLHDPEQPAGSAAVPPSVSLAALLGTAATDPAAMLAAWRSGGTDPALTTLVAVASDGPLEIDLVRDGPHALIAGTTGAGKSELLRSLVAGLATSTGPEHLSFVLIDYKGGAAFDACALLPHVVGMVTDLDERLAERALRSLHAELRRREQVLRDAGAADLTAYRAHPGRPPLPRLVVVVDEFATLATDLPGFVASLVGIAQRGRSLGVHLVLATQRPGGAVSDDIRANTNLRIALRVQDAADSVDVVGDRVAASLPRHRPGRAVVRFGPGELVPVQVAAVSVVEPEVAGLAITVEDVRDGDCGDPGGSAGEWWAAGGCAPRSSRGPASDGRRAPRPPTVLETLVATARTAAAELDLAVARPWLPSLPEDLHLDDLPPGAAGLVDDPDHQSQEPWTWDLGAHLLCIGAVRTGTTTALASVTVSAAAIHPPSALHVYVLDGGSSLAELAGLPHVGATIGPTESERQARLIRRLGAMLHRVGGNDGGPRVVLVVDRLAAWRQAVAERLGPELADLLDRILVEGPAAGVVVAGGLDRPGALPLAVSGAVGERLVFRLGDPADAATAGLGAGAVAGLPRGRAVMAGSGLSVQLARSADLPASVRSVADHWGCRGRLGGAAAVACLPTDVAVSALGTAVAAGIRTGGGRPRPCSIALGLGDADLEPVALTMHPGDPFLITGPARSGRSSALALVAQQLRQADPAARIFAVSPRPSPLADLASIIAVTTSIEGLVEAMAATAAGRSPRDGSGAIVLVDDADLVDDPAGALARLLEGGGGPGQVIAAGRTDALRAAYGHWTQTLRRRRRGLILCPESDLDGDVLGTMLPRWPSSPPAPGRGYLVAEGRCALVQLARCDLARFDPVWSRRAE